MDATTTGLDLRELDAADLAACRALLRTGSRSFHLASRLLPRDIADAATGLYAFCRVADDAIDTSDRPPDALERLRGRLADAYRGRPQDDPVDRAFAAVVRAADVPRELPEALLEGMLWDADGRRYETLSEVRAYAARVAAAVGGMMSVVMGGRSEETLARACDLGVAMQLSNIARDVGEDAILGRLYLPVEWLREEDLDPDIWLAEPKFSPSLGRVVLRLLDEAARLYERAVPGSEERPPRCRFGIHAAARIYAAIGAQVRVRDGDSVSDRAVVSALGKIVRLPGAALASVRPAQRSLAPPLDETRFLVDAAARPVAETRRG